MVRRELYIGCFTLVLSISGCASFSGDNGFFKDRATAYKQAKSVDNPLVDGDVAIENVSYEPETLYPIPEVAPGKLLSHIPRVTSAFISLDQNAIILHKLGQFDRVLFSDVYSKVKIEKGIQSFAENQEMVLTSESQNADIFSRLAQSKFVEKQSMQTPLISQWQTGASLQYNEPGFWRRLFGSKRKEHQFAFVISTPKTKEPAQLQGGVPATSQIHMLHRERVAGSKKMPAWQSSVDDDAVLGTEFTDFVEHLKREDALVSTTSTDVIVVNLERDGNGLPYLSIPARFAVAWEQLFTILPRQAWNIVDLDRSTGIVYINVKDKKQVKKIGLKEFQLNLSQGPQAMILSVEVGDDQPANLSASEEILTMLEQKWRKKNMPMTK